MGRVEKPHGVRGAVVVRLDTDNPDRFAAGARLISGEGAELVVESVTPDSGTALVRFADVTDRESAEELRGATLYIPAADRRPLAEGEFWPDELVGLEVRTPDGRRVGEVSAVVDGAAQERLVVATDDGGEAEIPFVGSLVPEVDPDRGYLVVVPIEGLL